jgi:hypothetical protein
VPFPELTFTVSVNQKNLKSHSHNLSSLSRRPFLLSTFAKMASNRRRSKVDAGKSKFSRSLSEARRLFRNGPTPEPEIQNAPPFKPEVSISNHSAPSSLYDSHDSESPSEKSVKTEKKQKGKTRKSRKPERYENSENSEYSNPREKNKLR